MDPALEYIQATSNSFYEVFAENVCQLVYERLVAIANTDVWNLRLEIHND